MEKEFFKDLPDTSTPLSASRLNKLLNGKESMGDITVESIKSKNVFTGLVLGVGLNTTTGAQTTSSTAATSDYIPVDFNENPNYYISGLSDTISSFVAGYNSNYEFLGRTGAAQKTEAIIHKESFTSGTPQGTGDVAYVRAIQYGTTETIQVVKDLKVQLEAGNEATSYSKHIDFNNERLDLSSQISYRSDITYSSKALKLYKSGKVMQLVGSVNATTQFTSDEIIATIPAVYITDVIRFFGVGDSGVMERFSIDTDGTVKCYGTGFWKGLSITWITNV